MMIRFLGLFASLFFVLTLHGGVGHAAVAYTLPGDAGLQVSLLTVDAGREIYELEGHTALRLKRPGMYDVVVNWGVFDFKAPNFVYRFTRGDAEYLCVSYPFDVLVDEYAREGRRVVEQQLALTPVEAERLETMVRENLRPENAAYRYNYIGDNCATRPWQLIKAAVGDSVTVSAPVDFRYGHTGLSERDFVKMGEDSRVTFRDEMSRYHANYPWYQFGIDLALGAGLDVVVMPEQRAFSPLYLHDLAAKAKIGDRELVAGERVVVVGEPAGVSMPPTPWYATPLAASIFLLMLTVIVTVADFRRRKLSRWFDTVLYGMFSVAGLVLTFLIFVSVHEATSPNWLFLWLNPLCLIPAVGVWIKSCKRVVYYYQFCNFAALIVLLAGHRFLGQAFNVAFPMLIACDLLRSFTYIYLYKPVKKA